MKLKKETDTKIPRHSLHIGPPRTRVKLCVNVIVATEIWFQCVLLSGGYCV